MNAMMPQSAFAPCFNYNAPQQTLLQSPLGAIQQADPDSSTGTGSGASGKGTPLDSLIGIFPPQPPTTGLFQQLASNPRQIRIELANKELWQKFHRVQNEMVVTRPGRKMFPKLELCLHGLDPKGYYSLFLCMQKLDNCRYKYQAGGWSVAGQEDGNGMQQSNHVQHHEVAGLNSGESWASQGRVVFERVKLTNKEIQTGGNSLISLSSMQKYQPVVRLCQALPSAGSWNWQVVSEFRPVECQFIAVTAYQSDAVTKLKVEHNPFAKGFREGSSRKRTLSPLPSADCPAAKRTAGTSNFVGPSTSMLPSSAAPALLQFPTFSPLYSQLASAYSNNNAWLANPATAAQLAALVSMSSSATSEVVLPAAHSSPPLDTTNLLSFYYRLWNSQQQATKGSPPETSKN